MTGNFFVTIIIATYNDAKTIEFCLRSLMSINYPKNKFEIIVVNDGSTDQTHEIVSKFPVTLVNQKHEGRPSALNRGIKESKGDIIAFTDGDCIVPQDWLQKHLRYYLKKEEISGVGGNQIPISKSAIDIFSHYRYLEEYKKTFLLSYDSISSELRTINGNNASFSSYAFDEIGGFDRRFLTGADVDLTRRLLKAGYMLIRDHTIRVFHLKNQNLFGFLQTRFKRGMAQTFYNIKYKRFKPKSTIKLLLPKYVLDKALYYSKNISNEKKLWKFKIFLLTVISKYFIILGEIYYYKKWVNGDTGKYTMI